MKAVLLDGDSLGPEALDLSALHALPLALTIYPNTTPAQVTDRVADADIILTNKVVVDEAVLRHAPHCRYIGVLATGMNNVDLGYCQRNGIQVRNVEGYGVDAVAQHALMLMLNLATSFYAYQQDVNNGKWSASPFFCLLNHPVMSLRDKHLVIVGYGALGQRFAQLCEALGMRVSVAARPGKAGDTRPALTRLLPQADVLSLHCQLSESTARMINADTLALMKPGALLVNTARGGLIDEPALLAALQSGHLGGVALDGLSAEPPPADHILLNTGLPNLLVTPHSAWVAKEARQQLMDMATAHLTEFISAH